MCCLSVTSPFSFSSFPINGQEEWLFSEGPASWNKLTTYKEEKTELSLRLFFYTLEAFSHHLPKRGQTLLTALWSFIHYSQRHNFVFFSLKRSQLPVEDLMDVLSVFVQEKVITSSSPQPPPPPPTIPTLTLTLITHRMFPPHNMCLASLSLLQCIGHISRCVLCK